MGILLHFGYFFALFALQTERKPLLFLIFVLFLRFLRKLLCQSTHKHQKYPLIEKKKKRPGVYQRYENVGGVSIAGATDGIVACCVRSNWGELGKVHTFESIEVTLEKRGQPKAGFSEGKVMNSPPKKGWTAEGRLFRRKSDELTAQEGVDSRRQAFPKEK